MGRCLRHHGYRRGRARGRVVVVIVPVMVDRAHEVDFIAIDAATAPSAPG